MRVLVHAPGPPGHGVVRHAEAVAELVRAHGVRRVDRDADLTHVQFTDALFGPDIASAATAFETWAAMAPRPLLGTLHDVPGADPDPARDARRGAGYAQVVAACDAVVVSAEHEAAKVTRLTGATASVLGLPVLRPAPAGPRPDWADRPSVAVLGFVYPGKGHDTAIDAAARHPDRPRVVVAGTAGTGHAALVGDLRSRAARRGVSLVVTGPLSDGAMTAAASAATVPLAPGAAVSASGSLATWLGAGRRPLARCGEYSAELLRRHPAALHLWADDAALDDALARALADPAHTRFGDAGPGHAGPGHAGPGHAELGDTPEWPDVGAAHAALYRGLLGC